MYLEQFYNRIWEQVVYNGDTHPAHGDKLYIIPGAFDPLHIGHLAIAHYIQDYKHVEPIFELCIQNIDKPQLSLEKAGERVGQFERLGRKIAVTRLTTFVQKARQWPGAVFCVGVDTVERVDDVGYYYGSKDERDRVLRLIYNNNCRFLVFPRGGRTLDDLDLSPLMVDRLCSAPLGFTPVDVSSTEIRESRQALLEPRAIIPMPTNLKELSDRVARVKEELRRAAVSYTMNAPLEEIGDHLDEVLPPITVPIVDDGGYEPSSDDLRVGE